MTVEEELYDVIDIVELELPNDLKDLRYKKLLGEFYVKLKEENPNPLYEQITPYHIDYLDALISIEQAFNDKDYSKVLSQIKSLILDKEGFILQGRMYYNVQTIFERHIEDTLIEFLNPFQIRMKSINEPTIFEYRVDEEGKKALKKHFSKTLTPIHEEKKQDEYNRFKEILKKLQTNGSRSNQERLDIIYDFVKRDIKTDPLTLVLFHDDPEGQYQVMKISREKEFSYKDFALFKTDGNNFYLPDNTMYRPVKDFRMAMLMAILQSNQNE